MTKWKSTLLSVTATMADAIRVLDAGGLRISLVIDARNKLLGTITDGDIRRALLQHLSMDIPALEIMQRNPVIASVLDDRNVLLTLMRSKDLLHVPLVDANGCLVGMETLQRLLDRRQYDNPVFLMAGGFGERLHPLTKEIPKPLLKVGSRPILETILIHFIESGFHSFYISTHYKAKMVKNHFGDGSDWGVSIKYVYEDKPLGTAGALGLLPAGLPKLPLLMMNGDLLTKVNFCSLLEFHSQQKGLATMCVREYDFQVPYGVVKNQGHQITSIVEKPTHSFFVNAGIYVLEPELVKKVDGFKYLDMPNLLDMQIQDGHQINSFPIHEYWLDIGQKDEFDRANRDIEE